MKIENHPTAPGILYLLRFAYSRDKIVGVKAVPGMRWDTALRAWVGYKDAVTCAAGLRPAPPINRGIVSRGENDDRLRGYQIDAVAFIIQRARAGCLLADDMGLGKTATAIAVIEKLGSERTLVVCPNYVRGVWERELRKWAPWLKTDEVFFASGTTAKTMASIPSTARVIVIHYDIIHAWQLQLIAWGPVFGILDECHALQSETSQRSKACKRVLESAQFRLGLSGTPMTNRPKDLWNVVDTLSPGRFGGFFAYGKRYCDAHQEQVTPTKAVWKFDGASNAEELRTRMQHFMLRRLKRDVSLELPAKTRQVLFIDVPAKRARLSGLAKSKAALRLALDKAADEKVAYSVEVVLEHVKAGSRVVCFTWRRAVAEHITNAVRAEGLTAHCIHGGIPTLRRNAMIAGLAASASSGVGSLLCATIDSSSTGIDLSYADVAVFAELTWEPHELLQAESRPHRFGQHNPVLIQYIIARGTADELVANAVIDKLALFEERIGSTGEALAKDLAGNEEDIMARLIEGIERSEVA